MGKTAKQYQIEAFPKDGRIWRIGWLGKFVKNVNVPSQLDIETILVPLRTDINPAQQNLNSKYSYDYRNKKSLYIGSGLLPILKVGNFWQDQFEVILKDEEKNKDPYTVIETRLSISEDNVQITDKETSPDLFLTTYYPEIDGCNDTKLLIINYPKDNQEETINKIIIPCNEVFRFYYAHSSQLTRALLNDQFYGKTNDIYNPELTYHDNDIAHVHLRRTIPDTDAAYVARLVFSTYAKAQASNIYTSGIRNQQNSNNFLIEARPPFEGQTTIKLEGKRVASSLDKANWNFLVFQIKSCSHPFPFSELTFSRDNDARLVKKEESLKKETSEPKMLLQTIRNTEETIISNKSEPLANLQTTELVVAEDSFPDLIGKKISKIDKEINTSKEDIETHFISGNNEGMFSTGAGTYGKSDTKPLAITRKQKTEQLPSTKKQSAMPANFNNFIETIAELSNFESINYNYLQLKFDEDIPSLESCSYFPAINSWAYIDLISNSRRQFITFEVAFSTYYFYFFEIETDSAKTSEHYSMFVAHNPDLQKLYKTDLKDVVTFCTKNYGRWLNEDNLRSINRKKFKHTSKNSEQCAKKFYLYMQELVLKQDTIKENLATSITDINNENNDKASNTNKIA